MTGEGSSEGGDRGGADPILYFAVLQRGGGGSVVQADGARRQDRGGVAIPAALTRGGDTVYLLGDTVESVHPCASQRAALDMLKAWRERTGSSGLAVQESGGPARSGRSGGRAGVVPLEGVRLRIRE